MKNLVLSPPTFQLKMDIPRSVLHAVRPSNAGPNKFSPATFRALSKKITEAVIFTVPAMYILLYWQH